MNEFENQLICTICGSQMIEKAIDYIDNSNDHFLIIRDVPVQECIENGHQFLHASVAKKIEQLFDLDRQQALVPKETIMVPVVVLDMVE
jgi:hypothetical protein